MLTDALIKDARRKRFTLVNTVMSGSGDVVHILLQVVKVNCSTCCKTFCLKHRLEAAHNCEGPSNKFVKKPLQ